MIKEREMMEKNENVTLKRIEKTEHIKKISHLQEHNRQITQEKILEKAQNFKEFMYFQL